VFPTRQSLGIMKAKLQGAQTGHDLLKRKSEALTKYDAPPTPPCSDRPAYTVSFRYPGAFEVRRNPTYCPTSRALAPTNPRPEIQRSPAASMKRNGRWAA
jgi:hypothetical protein